MSVSNNNTPNLVQSIKSQVNITDVISKYVDLSGSSRLKKGLCPFYPEKTPSFIVYQDTQSWHCFCGSCAGSEGGDVFSFLMKVENLSFRESLNKCAEIVGLPITISKNKHPQNSNTELIKALDSASNFFTESLISPKGNSAREYLNERGFSTDFIKKFGLGLSHAGMTTLSSYLKKVGISSLSAVKSGLIQKWPDGTWHDLFSERLTIEIRNEKEQLVGFSGRTLSNRTPKYINTPQTELFNKSQLLFGLNWAKESIQSQNQCVIVEGYMDVFTAHLNGYTNVVACMGTSVTEAQIKLGLKFGDKIILCLDSDFAGKQATVNNLIKLINTVKDVRDIQETIFIANLESGEDPDEIITRDPNEWKEIMDESVPLHSHLINNLNLVFDLTKERDRQDAANLIYSLISYNSTPHIQDQMLRDLSKKLKVNRDNLPKPKKSERKTQKLFIDKIVPEYTINPVESHIISLVLNNPSLQEYVKHQSSDIFEDPQCKEIFNELKSSKTIEEIEQNIDEMLYSLMQSFKSTKLPQVNNNHLIVELNDCINRLHKKYLIKQKKEQQQIFQEIDKQSENLLDLKIEEIINEGLKTNKKIKKIQSNSN